MDNLRQPVKYKKAGGRRARFSLGQRLLIGMWYHEAPIKIDRRNLEEEFRQLRDAESLLAKLTEQGCENTNYQHEVAIETLTEDAHKSRYLFNIIRYRNLPLIKLREGLSDTIKKRKKYSQVVANLIENQTPKKLFDEIENHIFEDFNPPKTAPKISQAERIKYVQNRCLSDESFRGAPPSKSTILKCATQYLNFQKMKQDNDNNK